MLRDEFVSLIADAKLGALWADGEGARLVPERPAAPWALYVTVTITPEAVQRVRRGAISLFGVLEFPLEARVKDYAVEVAAGLPLAIDHWFAGWMDEDGTILRFDAASSTYRAYWHVLTQAAADALDEKQRLPDEAERQRTAPEREP